MPLPWLLLSAILLSASFVHVPLIILYCKWPLRFVAAGTCFYSFWKMMHPGKAVVFETGSILIKGLRPGWWKLFQRWIWVRVSDEQVEDIRIGRIREDSVLGMKLPPIGEPSKASSLQNFLWIRYKSSGRSCEIYYPEIYDIQNAKLLIAKLKERLGEKVKTYPGAE